MESFAWALCVAAIVIVFMILFRKSISTFISNLKSLEYKDLILSRFNQQQQPESIEVKDNMDGFEKEKINSITEKKGLSNVDEALSMFRPETLNYFKDQIFKVYTLDMFNNDDDKIEYLKNYGVAINISKFFETIYYYIYGSQIVLLQHLNSKQTNENKEELKTIFDIAAKQYPEYYKNVTFDGYLDFLFMAKVIGSYDGKIGITDIGIDFLKYLIEARKSINKLF